MLERQKTIKKKISLEGIGLYTQKKVFLTFKPGLENTGFIFKRLDIHQNKIIPLNIFFIKIDHNYKNIILEKNGIKIIGIEHILATLIGLDLDNIIIELNNIEPPIMDGTAKYFIKLIEKVGIIEQNSYREYFYLNEIISYKDDKSEIIAFPSLNYEIINYVKINNELFNIQKAKLKNLSSFKKDISKARSFYTFQEIEDFFNQGINIDKKIISNFIIYINKYNFLIKKKKIINIFDNKNISILNNGILNNIVLNYPNEIAKHKLLDIIGYFSLIGMRIKAKIIINNPTYISNFEFIKKISFYIKNYKRKKIYNINIYKKAIFDINDILKILPHKPPFILLDKILEISKKHIVGIKNITMNETFFIGHFPKEPIMPGVLQIEAMAQAGCVFVLNDIKDNLSSYSTYFLKIDKAKFINKVIPGDILVIKMDLLQSIKHGIVKMQGYGFVNSKIVVEAIVMAKLVNNQKK